MKKSIVFNKIPEGIALKMRDSDAKKPAANQVVVKNVAVGINEDDALLDMMIDDTSFSVIPGYNASGHIVEVGADVKNFSPNNSVVYFSKNMGCYQESCVVNERDLIALPKEIRHKDAAIYFAALYAHTAVKRIFLIQPQMIVLIHNVTSGIGYLLAQCANTAGAIVIGTIDSDNKKDFALKYGCHKVVNYISETWDKEVMDITKNYGVNVVYDSLGTKTLDASMRCLTKMGILVCYGARSRLIKHVDVRKLHAKSLYITFPSIFDYKANRIELVLSANDVFGMISSKEIKIKIDSEYRLENMLNAHKKLKNNDVMGSMIANID
jgi:NADPH2:quinone reductase